MSTRLAIVSTHPIQYYAPWFRYLASRADLQLRVFYLDDPSLRGAPDPEFGVDLKWDVPLLDGYDSIFVPNLSRQPGSSHYLGLHNPSLWSRIDGMKPHATLLMAYHYRSLLPPLLKGRVRGPVFLRGDSHLLGRKASLRRWLADRVIRRAFSALDGALYTGALNREYFLFHGLAPSRLHFSPPAVDLDRFCPSDEVVSQAASWRRSLGIPEQDRVVLFAGKLIPKKRPLDLLRAFRQAALPDASLLFAGDGPLKPQLQEAAAGDSSIRFSPVQNQSAMPRTYAASDLMVLPSDSASETWGLAVNEAFAMGVPAVVSDRVGCGPDLVAGRDTGLVFPAGDVDALAEALRLGLEDPGQLARWGHNARELVSNHYSYREMSAGLESALAATAP